MIEERASRRTLPARVPAVLCATLGVLASTATHGGCGGYAQGFIDPVEEGAGGAIPELLTCPTDCDAPPCSLKLIRNVAQLFQDPGPVVVIGGSDGWVYFTVESGRSIARVPECSAPAKVEVFARTESAFGSSVMAFGAVQTTLPGGRLYQVTPSPAAFSLVATFDSAYPIQLSASPKGVLAATGGLDGLVQIDAMGQSTNVADVRYAVTPTAAQIDDALVAQRVNLDGSSEIVVIEGGQSRTLVSGPASDLQLLDARRKGVLFSHGQLGEVQTVSFLPLSGGSQLDLVRGRFAQSPRWTQAGVAYFSVEADSTGTPRVVLRELAQTLGKGLASADSGDELVQNPLSMVTRDRTMFVSTAEGNLYRRPIMPNTN